MFNSMNSAMRGFHDTDYSEKVKKRSNSVRDVTGNLIQEMDK